jgi:hypothetical protein
MLEGYKVLRALLDQRDEATVQSLSEASGVKEQTVRTILLREGGRFVEKVGKAAPKGPGGRQVLYRVAPGALEELAQRVEQFELVAAPRAKREVGRQVPTALLAAEETLLALPEWDEANRVEQLEMAWVGLDAGRAGLDTVAADARADLELHLQAVEFLLGLAELEAEAARGGEPSLEHITQLRERLIRLRADRGLGRRIGRRLSRSPLGTYLAEPTPVVEIIDLAESDTVAGMVEGVLTRSHVAVHRADSGALEQPAPPNAALGILVLGEGEGQLEVLQRFTENRAEAEQLLVVDTTGSTPGLSDATWAHRAIYVDAISERALEGAITAGLRSSGISVLAGN